MYGSICQDVDDVPAAVSVGDFYISCDGQTNWYEILEPPREGRVFVRLYSVVFRRGDYDRVGIDGLAARVTSRLFERARSNGFRSVRPLN